MTSPERITVQMLGRTELFHGLSLSILKSVAARTRIQRLPKNVRIFSQGDDRVHAHAVIEGGARIAQSGSDGAQVVVRFIGPGEIFGAVSLFTDGRYPGDAVTVEETLEASWSESALLELVNCHPQIAINLVRIIGKRLQEVQNRVREIATQRAGRRIAHAVLRLARQAGQRTKDGTAIMFPLRRSDLADIAGTTLHTASRILTAWEKAGLLVSCNQRLTLRDRSAIGRIAEDASD